jgi:hypothetical protein
MKRGHVPLWLLRDLPALIGIAWSFWPLMILVISSGCRAMRGKPVDRSVYDAIMHALPIAEAHLHYALCRQAWRALGWNVREIRLEILPPITDWSDVAKRFAFYRSQMMDLHAAATRLTEGLRETYRIRTRIDANSVHTAHASTDAACAAAQHELGGVPGSSCGRSQGALMLSSAQSARPSKYARGLANACGPPGFPRLPIPYSLLPNASLAPRQRERPRAPS